MRPKVASNLNRKLATFFYLHKFIDKNKSQVLSSFVGLQLSQALVNTDSNSIIHPISAKLKEARTNTGVSHQYDERSLSDGGTSFIISIPAFVADFKRNENIIIKNLPDGLANDNLKFTVINT